MLPPSRWARFGSYPAAATLVGAVVLWIIGLFVSSVSTTWRLIAIGVGAIALFIGVSMLAPKLVPPLARVLGAPAARIAGAPGELARGNSARNPTRTASTASALMIGLALVTMVGVLAAGLRTRFQDSVNKVFVADYVLTATDNFSPIGVAAAQSVQDVPGAETVSSVRAGQGRAFGGRITVTGVQPNVGRVISVPLAGGWPSDAGPARAERSLRIQGLRTLAPPRTGIADRRRDADRCAPAACSARRVLAAEGWRAVRRCDGVNADV